MIVLVFISRSNGVFRTIPAELWEIHPKLMEDIAAGRLSQDNRVLPYHDTRGRAQARQPPQYGRNQQQVISPRDNTNRCLATHPNRTTIYMPSLRPLRAICVTVNIGAEVCAKEWTAFADALQVDTNGREKNRRR